MPSHFQLFVITIRDILRVRYDH